jgi:ketosteroid isomerase-like protein
MSDADLDRFPGIYAAFNARDIETVLEALHPDVDWANAMEGGRVQGREQVRDYWRRVFERVDTRLEIEEMERLDDGRIALTVRQIVRETAGGAPVADQLVRHLFTMEEGLVVRFDVEREDQPG